ncbi:hypothetical protein NUU61_008662 [Penicillium alfredii]|uniref:Glucose-methanol-choline oxidoreductase C-terminal domain-containing protein n=1 Tax=Penicillium alfredii TaxID=1506179 RepID=A0A9W9ELJ8_9EURO|nr:uncharacterized protein NUU61_008662 [Penicillium alfredii]KAJ5084083.1 hypothetical protein NUU61_008662 [Penicillium alfredii]
MHFPVPPEGDWLTIIADLQPYVNLNDFSNELDILALKDGVRFIDDILMNGEGMKYIIGEDYPWPMPRDSDEEMDRVILDRSQTGFHPCGTTRLSQDIQQDVVDPELRVHGTKNLRMINASIIPVIPDCRIQNAVYMIGEKGADIIKDAHPSLYKGRK